jgi:hypothetical protein
MSAKGLWHAAMTIWKVRGSAWRNSGHHARASPGHPAATRNRDMTVEGDAIGLIDGHFRKLSRRAQRPDRPARVN